MNKAPAKSIARLPRLVFGSSEWRLPLNDLRVVRTGADPRDRRTGGTRGACRRVDVGGSGPDPLDGLLGWSVRMVSCRAAFWTWRGGWRGTCLSALVWPSDGRRRTSGAGHAVPLAGVVGRFDRGCQSGRRPGDGRRAGRRGVSARAAAQRGRLAAQLRPAHFPGQAGPRLPACLARRIAPRTFAFVAARDGAVGHAGARPRGGMPGAAVAGSAAWTCST